MYPYTAVIDIGSNSARLVIYQQINKNTFHIVYEKKSKVRIGEGAYLKNGYLQPIGIKRAYTALLNFTSTIKKDFPTSTTICIATSALRDAPNSNDFTELIRKELNLDITIINGKKEAALGALAAIKLLSIKNGITVDIGGGSSDLALIKNSEIIDTYSLNLGTVRLKELFTDKEKSKNDAILYIQEELNSLPEHFQSKYAISIGGTTRALSKAISTAQGDTLDCIHNFKYKVDDYQSFFYKIINADMKLLEVLNISKNRIDTISEGTLIWNKILNTLGSKKIISSGVGVREGVFLESVNPTNLSNLVGFNQ